MKKFLNVTESKEGDLLVFLPTERTFVRGPAIHTVLDITAATIKTRFPDSTTETKTFFQVWDRFIPGEDYLIFRTEYDKMLARLKYA